MAASSSARDQSVVATLAKEGSGEAAPWRRTGMRMMEITQTLEGGGEVGGGFVSRCIHYVFGVFKGRGGGGWGECNDQHETDTVDADEKVSLVLEQWCSPERSHGDEKDDQVAEGVDTGYGRPFTHKNRLLAARTGSEKFPQVTSGLSTHRPRVLVRTQLPWPRRARRPGGS